MAFELRHYLPCGWQIAPSPMAVKLTAPSQSCAEQFLDLAIAELVGSARRMGTSLEISWQGCQSPLRISPRLSVGTDPREIKGQAMTDQTTTPNDAVLEVLGADYRRILEKLVTWRDEGKIVIITSNTSNICLHTSDLLKPSRAVLTAAQFTGYNYLRSWRATREENPTNPQRLNPQFNELRECLARDGYVPGYEYTLYRPDDALCSYQTDYYLCRDYCGDEVRIGISRVEDWALLEPAAA